MSGNLGGFRSSGRFAALLTFPGMRFTKCHSRRRWVGSHDTHVAAGMNPAALAVLGVNLLIAEGRAASIDSTMRRYVPVSVRKPAQSR